MFYFIFVELGGCPNQVNSTRSNQEIGEIVKNCPKRKWKAFVLYFSVVPLIIWDEELNGKTTIFR